MRVLALFLEVFSHPPYSNAGLAAEPPTHDFWRRFPPPHYLGETRSIFCSKCIQSRQPAQASLTFSSLRDVSMVSKTSILLQHFTLQSICHPPFAMYSKMSSSSRHHHKSPETSVPDRSGRLSFSGSSRSSRLTNPKVFRHGRAAE